MHQLMLMGLCVCMPIEEFRPGGPEYQTEAITCHLPEREHLANSAGRDGLGLCVFTSIDLAARWANEPSLIGFRDFMKKHGGGGWPEKVDEFIPKMAASKNLPTPNYMQHTGGDPEVLKKALRTGRYVAVTYDGRDGVYYRTRVAHMVNLVHLSDQFAVIQDNNFPGKWLWMKPQAFFERWKGTGGGWAIVLFNPGPPPIPVNNRPLATSTYRHVSIQGDDPNYGLDCAKIGETTHYRLNGRDITRDEAMRAMDQLPDDRQRLRLTIVGEASIREQVKRDWQAHPALQALKDRVLVQDYPPEHWAVADVGFAPGLTLQTPPGSDGKARVIWRMPQYAGPDVLAGAIRKADPLYQPSKDADPSKADTTKTDSNIAWDWLSGQSPLWMLIGLVAIMLGRQFGLKIPSFKPSPDELKQLIRTLLLEMLKPTPPATPPLSDEELKKRIQEIVNQTKPS